MGSNLCVSTESKGSFQTLWLSLDAVKPELTFRAGGQFGVVMRTTNVAGCVVSRPKHVRKGHEMAIRLDLIAEDSQHLWGFLDFKAIVCTNALPLFAGRPIARCR